MPPLELWVGPECTVNRVGDACRDQLEETGFAHRLDDIDRIAELGARRVRFPLLWERTATGEAGRFDWRWCDELSNAITVRSVPRELSVREPRSSSHCRL